MQEQYLFSFNLQQLQYFSIITTIVFYCYRKTGNKFSVQFHGSKGYLSNVVISCEGYQEAENIIWIESLINKNGSLKSTMVSLFYSEEKGVRVAIGLNKSELRKLSA